MRVATSVLSLICLVAASTECLRVLQATGYKPQRGYFKLCLSPYFWALLAVQAAAIALDLADFGLYVNLGIFALFATITNAVKRKSPLKFTKRAVRILIAELFVLAPLCVFVNCAWFVWSLPVTILAAWAICLPIDALVARHYIRLATNKLRQSAVKVVAITGSYGKTSVKDMLAALLSDSIAPSGSCNTPLGIAAFINKTELKGAKFLILEFGARKRGDIAQLCQLYRPTFGIVTGVCAQHLSTFKTLQNVIQAKRELVENLPENGFCVLNASDKIAASFADCGICAKYLSCDGLSIDIQRTDFDGTHLQIVANGESFSVCLPQIADYVPDTLAMCCQTALRLGQDLQTTLRNVAKVRPTPHRLQLMAGANCHIADDSYNGSLAGVASSCKTLNKFRCPKAVITQGLVECGRYRREMNVSVGKMLGETFDAAVVLGRNGKFLAEGLSQTNCKILHAKNLQQAVTLAAPYAQGGILLFQNDLPDVANI